MVCLPKCRQLVPSKLKFFICYQQTLDELGIEPIYTINLWDTLLHHHPNTSDEAKGLLSVHLSDRQLEEYKEHIRISSYRWKDVKSSVPGDPPIPKNYVWFLKYIRENRKIGWMDFYAHYGSRVELKYVLEYMGKLYADFQVVPEYLIDPSKLAEAMTRIWIWQESAFGPIDQAVAANFLRKLDPSNIGGLQMLLDRRGLTLKLLALDWAEGRRFSGLKEEVELAKKQRLDLRLDRASYFDKVKTLVESERGSLSVLAVVFELVRATVSENNYFYMFEAMDKALAEIFSMLDVEHLDLFAALLATSVPPDQIKDRYLAMNFLLSLVSTDATQENDRMYAACAVRGQLLFGDNYRVMCEDGKVSENTWRMVHMAWQSALEEEGFLRRFLPVTCTFPGLRTAGLGPLYLTPVTDSEGNKAFHGVGTIQSIFGNTVVEVVVMHEMYFSVVLWVPEGVVSGNPERCTHPGLLADLPNGLHPGPRAADPRRFPVDAEPLHRPSYRRTKLFSP